MGFPSMASILFSLFSSCLVRPKRSEHEPQSRMEAEADDEINDDPVVGPDDSTWLLHQPQPTYIEVDPVVKTEMEALRSIVQDAENQMLNITDNQPFLFDKQPAYKHNTPGSCSSRSSSVCHSDTFYYETGNYSYHDRIAPPPTRRNSITQQPSHSQHLQRHHYHHHHNGYNSPSRSSLGYDDEDEDDEDDEDEDGYTRAFRRKPKLNVKLIPVPIGGIRAAAAAANAKTKRRKERQEKNESSSRAFGTSGYRGRPRETEPERRKKSEDSLIQVRELNDKDREAIIDWSDRIRKHLEESYKYPEPHPILVRKWGS
ncbi:uncharacterized protein EI90DRAFT_3054085 [Cantharellus anzutake]|uniref:uncharacterized protein n=1 Tax=Cantharellus anzutake TaxID=1750568 RepID=UPI00190746B5|nr:uncharacterized protein EI90DRAFT_3054085 [Cantharellus anzutake]KAF8332707.1 hypothetical protein EI90DRAFT_3054085 [Cantharellus anzutake]